MAMTRIGSRELKTRLGTYLRRVRAGETILVTERGEPAAELRPVPARPEPLERKLSRLASAGRVTLPTGPGLSRFRPIDAGADLSQAIVEEREDRF